MLFRSTLEGDTAETAMVKPSVDTEYYVTITDGLGGCSDVGSIVVNVTSETFDASITTDDEYCTSQAIDTLKVATPVGAWSGNGIVDNTIGLFDASVAGEGTHWVYYTIPGGCGTIDSAEVEVFLAGAITITTPQDICESGTTDTLLAIPGGGIWTGAGIMNQDLGVFDPQEVTPGTVDITYTLAVCGVSETTTLFVNPTKDVEFTSPFEICDGGLADTIYFADYDTGGVWTGVGLIEGLEGAFNPDSGVLGFNIIKYEFLDGCKNSFTDTIFIGNRKYATIDSVGVLCENGMSIQLSAANPSGVWTGNGIDDFGLFNPSLSVVGSNEIIYTIDGYCGDEDTLEVIVVNKPEMDFDIIEESCQLANDAGLESFVLGGSEPYTYLWSNGNTVQNIYDLESGSYTLTITDAIGCVNVKSASIEPSEEKCDEPFLFVGNIFSPNGDNANDILIPIGKILRKLVLLFITVGERRFLKLKKLERAGMVITKVKWLLQGYMFII